MGVAGVGADHPVQRCRTHKMRNVLERLPEEQKDQVLGGDASCLAAGGKAGIGHLEKLAQWLEQDYPASAASLREGLDECFKWRGVSSMHFQHGALGKELFPTLLKVQQVSVFERDASIRPVPFYISLFVINQVEIA